jgi:hypothetical protein
MRYGLVPENQTEQQLLEKHLTTRPLFDPLLPALQARAIMTAVGLRIFDAIGRGSRRVEDLAAELSLNVDALRLLLRVLTNAGYLPRRYRHGSNSTTPTGTSFRGWRKWSGPARAWIWKRTWVGR